MTLIRVILMDFILLTNVLFRYNAKAVLDDLLSINWGSVYENVVASELVAHGYTMCYYDSKKNGKFYFLVDNYGTLSAMSVEVKSGKDSSKHSSMDKFLATPDYHIQNALVLDNIREIRQDEKTTYMPVYFIMFLRPSSLDSVMI